MIERLKQFYEEHKTAVVVGAAGIAVAVLVTMRKHDGEKIASADIWQRADGMQLISVTKRNGDNVLLGLKADAA